MGTAWCEWARRQLPAPAAAVAATVAYWSACWWWALKSSCDPGQRDKRMGGEREDGKKRERVRMSSCGSIWSVSGVYGVKASCCPSVPEAHLGTIKWIGFGCPGRETESQEAAVACPICSRNGDQTWRLIPSLLTSAWGLAAGLGGCPPPGPICRPGGRVCLPPPPKSQRWV